MLDHVLWYYGRVADTKILTTEEWASRIMALHFFRTEEKKASEKNT